MQTQDATSRFYAEVWPHAPVILRTAQFLVRNAAEAEDLAQETLLKAFAKLDRFAAGTDVKAWLMTILRNTRIDRVRSLASEGGKLRLEEMIHAPEAPDSVPAGDEAQVWQDPEEMMQGFSDRQVIEAMRKLPEEIRWTLLLVDVEELDHAEAAKVLEVPVGTVKSRAHRGRAMLREALAPVAREMRMIRD